MYGFNEVLFDDIVDIDVPDTAVVIDVDDTVDEGPEVGVATGIADMVLRLINAENDSVYLLKSRCQFAGLSVVSDGPIFLFGM